VGAEGRPLKILTATDEHTREAMATRAARRLRADDRVNVLEQIVERRGQPPRLIRCDNGPEHVANALKDWCRFAGGSEPTGRRPSLKRWSQRRQDRRRLMSDKRRDELPWADESAL
jgi:transposase InsO family protein